MRKIMKTILSFFEWCIDKMGLETKWMRKDREDHEQLLENTKAIKELSDRCEEAVRQSIQGDEIISRDLKRLTDLFIDKQIDDMRYEILDFASSLSSGRILNLEAFDHIMKIYQKYEKILEENNMDNGLVQESIKFITEKYHSRLEHGL